MASILLAIKPEFVYKIIKGEKHFEFRRRLCKKEIDKIYLYAGNPVKKVIAEVEVTGKLVDDKEAVWNITHDFSGISKAFYDSYFEGMKQAGAYCLGEVLEYEKGKELAEFGICYVPQSFVYV